MSNLIGQQFGKLTVISYAEKSKWFCICDCNPRIILEKSILTGNLKSGNTTSCGCLQTLKEGEASFNNFFLNYKRNAIKRNCNFKLTKEEFKRIVIQNCNYCKSDCQKIQYIKHLNGAFFGNGIDQQIAQGGYTKENCVPCCVICNHLKLDLSLENWQQKLERIINKNYNNLFFDYNFKKVSKEQLKIQRANCKRQKRNTKNQINTLTEHQYYHLATSNCFYCDAIPNNFDKSKSKGFYQGIDQIIARGGYIFENCLPCCYSCNMAKSNMPYEIFLEYLKKLQQYQKSLIEVIYE